MKTKIILLSTMLFILACKKESTNQDINTNQIDTTQIDPNDGLYPPIEAELFGKLMQMLSSIGIRNYTDIFRGKLEGNFSIYANTYPIGSNCYPFKIGSILNGIVTQDSINKTAINAGDLYLNNIKIEAEPTQNYYSVALGQSNYTQISNEIDKLFGEKIRLNLLNGVNSIIDDSLYVPNYIKLTNFNCANEHFNNGDELFDGYTLNWNADYKNLNGVLIEFCGNTEKYEGSYWYRIVPDNGKYTIRASDISRYSKELNPIGVKVSIYRTSFLIDKGTDNRKYNFNFYTNCSYYYLIK